MPLLTYLLICTVSRNSSLLGSVIAWEVLGASCIWLDVEPLYLPSRNLTSSRCSQAGNRASSQRPEAGESESEKRKSGTPSEIGGFSLAAVPRYRQPCPPRRARPASSVLRKPTNGLEYILFSQRPDVVLSPIIRVSTESIWFSNKTL